MIKHIKTLFLNQAFGGMTLKKNIGRLKKVERIQAHGGLESQREAHLGAAVHTLASPEALGHLTALAVSFLIRKLA